MTTTHTFQGLNTDSKPSSRVLNPPGGSSSNIFGVSDAQPPVRTPARTGSDSSSQSSTNVIGQGQNPAAVQKSRASRNAFNPITGEPYDQPQSKPQPKQPTSNASQSSTTETAATSGTLETAASLSSATLSGPEQHPAPDSAQAKPTGQQPSPPVEQGTAPPAAVAVQPGTAPPAAAQQSRNQQSGIFGGSEQVQDNRSTRVSQPPGGRSTKLW